MVPCGYCILVIFSNYFTVKRGNLAYFSSFLSLLKSNLKKSLICSTHMGPFWIAILILHTKSFQKIFTFLECLIFCLNQTLAGCDYITTCFWNVIVGLNCPLLSIKWPINMYYIGARMKTIIFGMYISSKDQHILVFFCSSINVLIIIENMSQIKLNSERCFRT